MSSNQSDPISNPTQIVSNPKQVMSVKPAARVMDYTHFSINQPTGFNTNQMDWIQIAKKNKFVKKLTWTVNNLTDWISLELTPDFILDYAQVANKFQMFFSATAILVTIQPTNNTFMQGVTKVAFDPAPKDYYKNVLGVDPIALHAFQQFENFEISPKTSDTYNMIIPINIPFPYMCTSYKNQIITKTETQYIFDYLSGYPLGNIRSKVFAPLDTKSPITQLEYNLSMQLLDLRSDGMSYVKIIT